MGQCIIANESRILRHIMRRIVERRGFDVIEARDGPEVIDLFHQTTPDLLCIDDKLPDLDGISVLQILRTESGVDRLPPTLFTFIERDEALLARAMAAGAGATMQKPFTAVQMDGLLETLTA